MELLLSYIKRNNNELYSKYHLPQWMCEKLARLQPKQILGLLYALQRFKHFTFNVISQIMSYNEKYTLVLIFYNIRI